MAQGRPTKWATAWLREPIPLGKAGIEITIWDKWRKKRLGRLTVSVGGIRWFPYKARRANRTIKWDEIERL